MQKFATLQICLAWNQPVDFGDFVKIQNASQSAQHPGIYLHVTFGAKGVVTSYIGKSESSINARQREHFEAYANGAYHVFDEYGAIVHTANTPTTTQHDDDVAEHLLRTKVYAASISGHHMSLSSYVCGISEDLLLRSRQRRTNLGVNINKRSGNGLYQNFQRVELVHKGAALPRVVFGPNTVWDGQTGQIR